MLAELLDLLWPRTCAVCGRQADRPGRHLCSECLMRLPFVPTSGLCRQCGRDAAGLDVEYLCDDCRGKWKPAFDRAASALRYDGDASGLVGRFKFRGDIHLRDDLVDCLEGVARSRFRLGEIGLVIPMPSTLSHRFWRGYSQCAYLAKPLAKRLKLPYAGGLVRRVGHPRRQAGLSEAERRENVVGTFAVTPKGRRMLSALPSERAVLVVDDIMTTGATLSACAKTLKEVSGHRVWCVTVARSFHS